MAETPILGRVVHWFELKLGEGGIRAEPRRKVMPHGYERAGVEGLLARLGDV
jgi:hypothetical protein